jgi:predicted transcriptional regulator
MTDELKNLPKPAKVEATKALKELDFTFEQIADTLGIGERTAYRYIQEQTDEEWQEFGSQIKKLIKVKEEQVASKALSMIEEKMPRAQFRELVGLYKVIRELQISRTPAVANQINIGGEMGITFTKKDVTS